MTSPQSFAAALHGDANETIPWFAPAAFQFDTPGQQGLTITMGNPVGMTVTGGAEVMIAATHDVSVFPAGDTGGADLFMVADLPFTHDVNFDDAPVYTASNDTPWIFVSDFSSDGWFFA